MEVLRLKSVSKTKLFLCWERKNPHFLNYHVANITQGPQLKKAVSCDTTCHPIVVRISQPSSCMSIIRTGRLTRLFNYFYVGVSRHYICIHQGCSSGPVQCLSVQRANVVLGSAISNPSNLSVCWPWRISSFPPSMGCCAQGYSTLWWHRMQFCSLLPHFCIDLKKKKLPLLVKPLLHQEVNLKKPTIFLTLRKKPLSKHMFSWL